VKPHAGQLRHALAASHALAAQLDKPGSPLRRLENLQAWQRKRLAVSYADLIGQKRYRPAGEFFLNELYGGLHFRERDQEVEKVLPVMIRTLRDDMIRVLAEAFDLQGLSLELDLCMVRVWQQAGWPDLDEQSYGTIYRRCGQAAERSRQIELIRQLGLELNELVHHRLVLMLVRLLRGPARAAGFGLLQGFLEAGLNAFQRMGDGTEFVMTIWRRESRVMERLLAAHPEPFSVVH